METPKNDVTLNNNANNTALTQDHNNINTIDHGLPTNEIETVEKLKDHKQPENTSYNNNIDCNESTRPNKTKFQDTTSNVEPAKKIYKTSSGEIFINYTIDDDVDVSTTDQDGQSCSDSNVNNDGPSCSNYTSSFKPKSRFKKRHYRKRSEIDDERDDEPEKKVSETPSQEDSDDDSNISNHSLTENSTRRPSSDQISELDDVDGMRLISLKVDEDSSEWSGYNDDDDESRQTPQVLKNPIPKHNLFIVPELMRRELGYNQFLHRKFYGSLHAVQRLELMYKMEQHEERVNAINFNEDGSLLASASDDLKVVLWDWAVGRKRAVLDNGHTLKIFETKWLFNHNKDLIATCARDGHVRLIDTNTNENRKLASHRGEVRRLAVHPNDPHTIFSVGDDGKVFVIDIRDQKPTHLLRVREKNRHTPLYSIHINPRNSNEFCTGGYSKTVKIFDRRRPLLPIQQFTPQHFRNDTAVYVTCAVYNYNGTEIIASYNADDIYLFDPITPANDYNQHNYAHKYAGHRNNTTVKSVNFFGPKSEFIVSGSDCGNIFFWDKNTEAIVQWMPGDERGGVNRLEPHPYVPILATSGLDSDVKIWVPSCEHEPKMKGITECVKSNSKYRSNELSHILNPFDSPSILFFSSQYQTSTDALNRLSRFLTAERRLPFVDLFEAESDSSSVDSRSSNSNSNSDRDGSQGRQCTPS